MAKNLTRRTIMVRTGVLAFAGLVLAACAGMPDTSRETTVYLVRHAEKLKTPVDPQLSEAGRVRADELAARLSEAGLTAIYSTDTTRTRQTARPIAAALELPVLIYDGSNLEAVAAQLKTMPGRILVVGHSNTTPQLTALLGGDARSEIDEASEYDRLYVVHMRRDGTAWSELERYGARYEGAPAK